MHTVEPDSFERVARAVDPDAALLRTWSLRGGISAQMTAIEIALRGTTRRLIVRRPADHARPEHPRAVAKEFRLLQRLRRAGLPTPTPVMLDETGAIFDTPYLVVDFIDGEPDFAPSDPFEYVAQVATQLARVHRNDAREFAFLPQLVPAAVRQRERKVTNTSLSVGGVRAALEQVAPHTDNAPTLLHGDFWPGNMVWNRGRIVGIVDWEEACVGDPLSDVAISRLDILWLLGIEAMREFTRCYRAAMHIDFGELAYWDLDAAMRPAFDIVQWASQWPDLGRPDITEATMRTDHAKFVDQALAALGR